MQRDFLMTNFLDNKFGKPEWHSIFAHRTFKAHHAQRNCIFKIYKFPDQSKMVIKKKSSCCFSLKHNRCWVGRKALPVGFERRPVRVHVVLDVVNHQFGTFILSSTLFSPRFLSPLFPSFFSLIIHPNPVSLPCRPRNEWTIGQCACTVHIFIYVFFVCARKRLV